MSTQYKYDEILQRMVYTVPMPDLDEERAILILHDILTTSDSTQEYILSRLYMLRQEQENRQKEEITLDVDTSLTNDEEIK